MEVLRRIPVAIEGAWQPISYVGRARWEGTATADEPITALALGRDHQHIYWARAGRPVGNALKLVLSVLPNEGSDSRYDVHLHFTVQPPEHSDSSGAAGLDLTLRLSSTAPFVFSLGDRVTGDPAWFARPWTADDRFDFGALFVARADTRSARNHLWHLKESVVAPDDFAEALAYGRNGRIARRR